MIVHHAPGQRHPIGYDFEVAIDGTISSTNPERVTCDRCRSGAPCPTLGMSAPIEAPLPFTTADRIHWSQSASPTDLPAPPKRDGGFGALIGATVGTVLEVAVIVCVWELLGAVL